VQKDKNDPFLPNFSPELLSRPSVYPEMDDSGAGLTDEQVHFVRQTVSRLPDKFRKVIIMRFMAGLSAVQIAEKLGKRHGTIRVWLHRAYQILRKDLVSILEEVE